MTSLMTNAVLKSVRLKGGFSSLLQVNSCAANNLIFTRDTSFFNKGNVETIWDSMTSVSNTGKKRGRASRGRLMKRFNIYKGRQFKPVEAADRIKERVADESGLKEREEVAMETTAPKSKFLMKPHPLDRGYTGKNIAGKRTGVPKNIDGFDFEERGFQSVCLQIKYVARMTATQKNVVRTSALVVLGNGNGLAGYAVGKAKQPNVAIQIAKQRAALRLEYFEPFNGRTLWHNFHEQYHKSKLFAFRKHEGYGHVCHRVLKSVCEVIGIKDIYVKVEGQTKNSLALTAAFFNGLGKQKTHQAMADETGYNIVEYAGALDNFPRVIASPSKGSESSTTLKKDLGFDYESYFLGGVYHKRERKQYIEEKQQHRKRLFREYRVRNQAHAKMMRAVYGLERPPKRY